MNASMVALTGSNQRKRIQFARRSRLPLKRGNLWQIEAGAVRTLTWLDDGNVVTLGLWGTGDIVSQALFQAKTCQIECLTPVEATLLPLNHWHEVNEALIHHIQQFQEFLVMLQCRPVDASLLRLLSFLAKKFGREAEQGQLIDLRLTHQELAEIIGTTRVTVTRLLKEFEQQGIIERLPRKLIVLHEEQPFWHYEI